MSYVFERLAIRDEGQLSRLDFIHAGTIFQSPAWLSFLVENQKGEPVIAVLKEGTAEVGYFIGMIVRKFGLRILGSPFPGWSSDYMGFVLAERVDRNQAVRALIDFVFGELRCIHFEVMDRLVTSRNLDGLNVEQRAYRGFEIDLTQSEDDLFAGLTSACRRCIRKAEKEGVRVEEAHDPEFADDYYAQLQDVFAKQGLVPNYGVERVRQLITHVHPTGHLLLLRARDRTDRCIATGIFPHMNGVMYFWGGASWRLHQLSRPNEAIQWQAMRIGKKMGLYTYDMGGGGEYKRKYGGREIEVPWFRKSKYPWIRRMRELAQRSYSRRQRLMGCLNRMLAQG